MDKVHWRMNKQDNDTVQPLRTVSIQAKQDMNERKKQDEEDYQRRGQEEALRNIEGVSRQQIAEAADLREAQQREKKERALAMHKQNIGEIEGEKQRKTMDQQQDVVQKRIDEKQKREKKQEKLKNHKDTLADLQKAAVSHELAQEIGLGEEEKRRVDRRLYEEEEERHRQQRKEDELRDEVKQKRFKEAREQVINEGKRENEMQARVFSDKLEELKHLNKIEADKRMQFVMQIDSNRQLAELEQVLAKTAAIHKSKIAAEQRFMERAKDDMNSAVEKEREQVKRLEEQEALLQQKIGAMLGQFRRAVDLAEQGTLTAEGGQGENDIRELINKLNGQVREALGTDDVGKEEEEDDDEEEDEEEEEEEEEDDDDDDDDDDSSDDDDSRDDEEDRKKDRSGWIRDIEKDKDQDMNGQILDDFGNKNEKRIRGYIPEDDEIKNKEQEQQQQQKDQEQKDILIQSNLSPTINQPQQSQPSYQSSLLSPPPSSTYNQRMTYPNNSIQRKRPSSSITEYKQSY
ncbi:MAG: hypothetical protein EZS28_033206, partial [Streblomastix strix]